MTGFKPRISGVGSDRSTNWATTTTQGLILCPTYIVTIQLHQKQPTAKVRSTFVAAKTLFLDKE